MYNFMFNFSQSEQEMSYPKYTMSHLLMKIRETRFVKAFLLPKTEINTEINILTTIEVWLLFPDQRLSHSTNTKFTQISSLWLRDA